MTLANRVLKILNERNEETVNFTRSGRFIKERNFRGLFFDLGWDLPKQKYTFDLPVADIEVNNVAELDGFVVLEVFEKTSKRRILPLEKNAIQKEINNIVGTNNILVFHGGGEVIFRHSSTIRGTEISLNSDLFAKALENLFFTKDEPRTLSDVNRKVDIALNRYG